MTIETRLSKEQFIRLSILRHIQRKTFYFWAFVCAVLTAYALLRGPYLLLLGAWVPFLLYLLVGVLGAFRAGADENQPYFLPTRYEFTKQGVSVSTAQNSSHLQWQHFAQWKMMARCYVLVLSAGPILAIPTTAVPPARIPEFESLLA